MNEAKEKTALCTSVGADERQSVQNTISSISALDTEINHPDENSPENFEDIMRQMQRMSEPAYLHTVSMNELYETVYQSRPPVIDGLLYSGTYLFAGAPKVGKSFFMAQLAYHISTGQPLWNYEVHQGTVLYLALEDDYQRLQERMSRMFGVEGTDNLHFAVYAKQLGAGLDEQLEKFIREHPDTRLIIIDTLQKIREVSTDAYSYANDYDIVGRMKQFADKNGVCLLLVHHTRKQQAGDKFEMISGTTGLLGCADGAFLLQKEKRTDLNATLEIVGRDQPDQKLHLTRDAEKLTWQLDHAETELWKKPPDPLLSKLAAVIAGDTPVWNGSATELVALLGEDMQPNVDPTRTHLNVEYCYTPIEEAYHQLFDAALAEFNAKQKRKDRCIENYYEKILDGKQEKPFYEVIFQVGNKDDMGTAGENAELAKTILDKFYRSFLERNPQLHVYSAHLHMDEATPHLHIDFIPFTTGSKRGLSTRVSLKQALADQGITGEGRSLTERDLWVQKEKEALAEIMLEHGIEWEQKGEHKDHLSVLEFKREKRKEELAELEQSIERVQQQQVSIQTVEQIEAKPLPLTSKVAVDREDYQNLVTAAQKYVVQEKQEGKLKKLLKEAKKTISDLKAKIQSLTAELSAVKAELAQYKSVRGKLRTADLEQENSRLRSKIRSYESAIERNDLWHIFNPQRNKTYNRDDAR